MTWRPVRWFEEAFMGHQFAVFAMGLLSLLLLMFVTTLVWPSSETGFGAFAQDFKTWCFSYDPATGRVNAIWTAVMFLNPLMLIGIMSMIWGQPIAEALRERRGSVARVLIVAAVTFTGLVAGMVAFARPAPQTALPFPAERLRMELSAPVFDLENQAGERVRLEDLRGRVVLVTAVYATCHNACPTIITTVRQAVAQLTDAQRADLTVVAISLDPHNDTLSRRAATAKAHQLEAPFFNYVNGDPAVVEELLDRYSFARVKNEATGEVDHSNMFVLIDRDQKIAFRLNLGDRHQPWLPTALRVLLGEE